MTTPPLARRLSSSDAGFLYVERDEAPMHIGAIAVVDGDLDPAGYTRSIAAKLDRLPRFKQKVVPAPWNLGHPTWEDDRHFELARHIFVHEAPAPGGLAELFETAAAVFTGMLDRSKPVWELHIVRGLAGGRSALVSKIHHAMADGVGANELVTTLFDLRPTPAPPQDSAPSGGSAARAQGEGNGAGARSDRGAGIAVPALPALDALLGSAGDTLDAWSRASIALLQAGRTFTTDQAQITLQAINETMPDVALPLARLPWNRAGSRRRKLVGTEFSFAEARAIRGAIGGTVNDVVLAALGGAVARYCRRHGVSVAGRSMRVMVPVNVRSAADESALGNQVSLLPVSVPLDIDDPVRRLRTVHGVTRILKNAKVAEGLHQLATLWGAMPPPLQAALGAIGAFAPGPAFNLVCTNVPGPQIRLYALEHPVIAYYPSVPVGFQMGVGCAIYSYDQRLFIGLTADLGACPDVEMLLEAVEESLAELRAAAGVASMDLVHMPRQHGGHLLDRAHQIAHHEAALHAHGKAEAEPVPAESPSRKRRGKGGGGGAQPAQAEPAASRPARRRGKLAQPGTAKDPVTPDAGGG